MANTPSPDAVLALYREGVTAIAGYAAGFTEEDWNRPACGVWSSADTVRHLLGVADWYHDWLERSNRGELSLPFKEAEFDTRNAQRVTAYAHLSGPVAVERFVERTNSYLERAVPRWEQPFAFPLGTVTVGLHLGVAATEWHLHAHDLACAVGQNHRPNDPGTLFLAAGTALANAKSGARKAILLRLVPIGARRKPWATILKQSGRTCPPSTARNSDTS